MANEGENDAKSVGSTAELAKKLGLSRWAVSRALNGRGGVSKGTVARVRAALREYDFTPDPLARGLRGGASGLVGVCLSRARLDGARFDHGGLHPNSLNSGLHSMYNRLSERGMQAVTIVAEHPAHEAECLRRLAGLRVEAVLLVAPSLTGEAATAAGMSMTAARPCVAIDPAHELPCASVKFDRSQSARMSVQHLQQLGHKRLALLGMPPGGSQLRAFEAAANALGAGWRGQVRALHLDDVSSVPTSSAAFGWALADVLLRRRAGATGWIAADDQIAAGALARLRLEGKTVPRDFSLVGYGNLEISAFCDPPLATVDPQTARLFERAVDTLGDHITAAGQIETQEVMVNPLFLRRASTAAPAGDAPG